MNKHKKRVVFNQFTQVHADHVLQIEHPQKRAARKRREDNEQRRIIGS